VWVVLLVVRLREPEREGLERDEAEEVPKVWWEAASEREGE
jgi:hypothetical protein